MSDSCSVDHSPSCGGKEQQYVAQSCEAKREEIKEYGGIGTKWLSALYRKLGCKFGLCSW